MSGDKATGRGTIAFYPAKCHCGEYLKPDLVETTMFASSKEWILTWQCPFALQHRWKAANES